VLLASWVLVVGFSTPAFAGSQPTECGLTIEINALRGGSPTAPTGGTKDITSKARILKGSAPGDATVTNTVLTITSLSGDTVIDEVESPDMLTLVVGKGGQGDKLTLDVGPCVPGETIDFVSHFMGIGPNGAVCQATSSRLPKTCK
jgi:hypothetical protein